MLEEYIKELEQDLRIDELNLKDYQLRLPALKHKWSGRLIRLKSLLNSSKKQKDSLKTDIMSEINATSPVKLTQPVISSNAEKHSKIREINEKIQEIELLIELLEKAEKILSSATFDVRNIIEIMKLELT
jgi:hypothetical protein